ncbi:MAG: hypothetical protein OJJ54_24275 [Pseudonocardia sp.]|nr:hypothetical protein [Pseudonocardia sp.]
MTQTDLFDLFAASTIDVERSAPNRLLFVLRSSDVVLAAAQDLLALPQWPFTVDVRHEDAETVVEVTAPDGRQDLLDDLAVGSARARSTVSLLPCPC